MKAYLYMAGYGFSQTVVWMLVSYLSSSVAVPIMFFFRNLIGGLIAVFIATDTAFCGKSLYLWKTHLIRASATLFGGLSIFYSVTKIPVADSVAVTFLAPLFGSVLSVCFLGEKFTLTLLLKLIGGIIGVLFITGFSAQGNYLGYAAAVLGAFMTGVAYVSVKKLTETNSAPEILRVSYFIMLPVSTILAVSNWQPLTFEQLILLGSIGIAFYFSQAFMARAFSLAPASKVLPVDYIRVIFSSLLGMLLLDQAVSIMTCLGAGIILFTSVIREQYISALFIKTK